MRLPARSLGSRTVDCDIAVAEDARGEYRDRHHRAVGPHRMADIFRARHLAGVELEIGQHPVEDLAGVVDGEEIEVDAVRLHIAGVEREHAVIEPAGERDWNSRHAFPALSIAVRALLRSSPRKRGSSIPAAGVLGTGSPLSRGRQLHYSQASRVHATAAISRP